MTVCWKKAEAEAGAIIVAAATSGIKNLALMAGDCRRAPGYESHCKRRFSMQDFRSTARRRRRGRLGQELAQAASERPGT